MNRLWIITFCLICSFQISNAQYLTEYQFGGEKRRVDIPFEYENGMIVIKVVLNKIFPLRFIFDTGAEHSILTRREITDLLAINYQRKFTLYGADMSTELVAYLAPGLAMEMGNLQLQNRSILVLEEDYLNFDEFSGIDVHGIIGADIFRRFVVQINYARKTITLYPFNRFKVPNKNFTEYPIEIHRSKPYISVPITAPNDSIIDAKLLLDSGSSLPLILYPETSPGIEIPENVIPAQLGLGLGGYLEGVVGRVKHMAVGETEFNDVIASFQSLAPGTDSIYINERNGIIGNRALENFHLIIDYVNYHLYLKPIKRRKKPKFSYDKSGLFLVAGGPNVNQFKVASIVKGSPGGIAGLKVGDDIKKINGVPCAIMNLATINRKFRKKEGKEYSIVFRRDGVRMKTKLVLKKLI